MKKYINFIMLTLLVSITFQSKLHSQIITTVAGTGVWGYTGDGILATTAKINNVPRIAILCICSA
jgi:hypothetical protein